MKFRNGKLLQSSRKSGVVMKKKIIIYGMGKYGKALYHFLERNNIKILGFLINKVDKEESYEENPAYNLKDFTYNYEELIVLLAVADINVRRYAKTSLILKGMEERDIFDCVHFIEENCLEKERNGEEHYCLICGKRIDKFLPAGEEQEIFKSHHIIGGGKRKHALCPNCGCLDRNRWCLYVLAQYTDIVNKSCTVLHFAPEEGITEFIKTNKECIYYSADLLQNRAMLQVDLTNILFCDAVFDYIILNHVLEHISKEKIAIQELKRVLKTDGVIIMSFPICMDSDTYEDKSVVTDVDRKIYFGQEDHVRLYGKDYKERLEAYGLSVDVCTPKQGLSYFEIRKYGFIEDDVILLCRTKE